MGALMSAEFASLQLALVDRFAELGMGSRADGAHRLTNFLRRLGLGTPTDPPSDPRWIDLLGRIEQAPTHDDRVDAVMQVFASLPPAVPEHIVRAWPTEGAFSIEVSGTAARTHFYALDDDDTSPLHPSKHSRRRDELVTVLARAVREHPDIDRVVGGSWLYTTRSYASLFPATHVANAVVRRGRASFRGMSHWGQFLDHRGHLRPGLADQFRHRVSVWTGDDPCALFPLDTLEVDSPITLFKLPRR